MRLREALTQQYALISERHRTSPLPHDVDDGRGLQEYDQAYGYKITTKSGYVDIVFRNSSNGYYGGWLDVVVGDKVSNDYVEISDDWKA